MQHTEPSAIERSLAIYRRLLRAYPPAFRNQYGDEMARVFRDAARAAWRQAGFLGLIALWARTMTDTLVNATREHVRGSGEGVAMSRWAVFARKALVPLFAPIALLAMIACAWAVTVDLLPLLPPANRGWAVLVEASVIGVLAGLLDTRTNSPATWLRSIVWFGTFCWLLWVIAYDLMGLSGPWAGRLPMLALLSALWTFEKDRSQVKETGLMEWKRLLLIAVLALVQLLVAPAPYVATNVFLVFVVVINGVATLLLRIELKARKGDADGE